MAKTRGRPNRRSRAGNRPKGSYPLPDGSYVVERTYAGTSARRLHVTAVHRAEPDPRLIARALLDVAAARFESPGNELQH